jgi:hypothetical protein
MTSESKFDVPEDKPAGQPTTGQPTPTAPLRHPGTGEPIQKKMPERRVRGGTAAGSRPPARPAHAKASHEGEAEAGLFFLFTPGFLLFLGALLLALLWAGGLFQEVGDGWAWDAFRGEDGAWAFQWSPRHILTILGAAIALIYLIYAFVGSHRGRGVAVLTLAGLGLVALHPTSGSYLRYVGSAFLGLAGGAVLATVGLGGRRGLALVAVLLLAAVLFLPYANAGDAYGSLGWDLAQELFGGDGTRPVGEILQDPPTALILVLFLLLVVALLVWIGLSGPWAAWTAGILLLLGVLAPLVLLGLDHAQGLGEEAWAPQGAVIALADGVAALGAFLAFALPVAAGIIDLARGDR